MDEHAFMRRAIDLARQNVAEGLGGPVGAVVVRGGQIIGEGANRVIPTHDPTAHAEIVAIRDACNRLGTYTLAGCTINTSAESCPMCLAAILWARMDAIVYAADRSQMAEIGFDDAAFYVEVGRPLGARRIPEIRLLADESVAVLREWAANPDRVVY
jgi:tRNA(Arg) A34 adenosine deaminase TadA